MAADKVVEYKSKRHYGWLLLALVLGVFAVLCIRPVMRLKQKPPTKFLEMPEKWSAERRAAEAPAALAYWECARQVMQGKYTYGTPLPTLPPPEFNIAKADLPRGSSGKSNEVRLLHWTKLQQAWALPQSWDKTYEWSTYWVAQNLLDFQRAVIRIWDRVLQDFKT
ncbi:MAG TPA: hypothetical protein VM182_03795 [Terriglobia bacterium]|nr:hypothetical protein [Terriglobia bacterium]